MFVGGCRFLHHGILLSVVPTRRFTTHSCTFFMCTREIFMEKHWRSVISRSVCDYFFEAQTKATSPEDIPPVISTPHYYLISIYRNNLYFLAVLQNEGTACGIIRNILCSGAWLLQTGLAELTLSSCEGRLCQTNCRHP